MPTALILILLIAMLSAVEPWSGSLPQVAISTTDAKVALGGDRLAMVRVHHPATGAGPFPLLIFSHGLAGSREGYGFLARRWAEHGYVVVQPDHPGSDTAAFRNLRPAAIQTALQRATRDPEVLAGRPRLVADLIDGLDALEQTLPALAGRIDRTRIGVGGHSFGAWTTLCVAGMLVRGAGFGPSSWSDPRPQAFLALSPSGPGTWSQPGDWDACTRPMLVMTGSGDREPALLSRGEPRDGAWRRRTFEALPAGGKLLAWFEGATHCTYSGGAGAKLLGESEPDPAQVEAVAALSLAWWDARLRRDPAAQAWLADPAAPASLGAWASFTSR